MKTLTSPSHRISRDQLRDGPYEVRFCADAEALAALSARFDLLSLDRAEATVTAEDLGRDAGVRISGHVSADLAQACVVSGEPVAETVEADFAVRLVSQEILDAEEEEALLDPAEDDLDLLEEDRFDLIDIAVQTIPLEMSPYPRSPAAQAALDAVNDGDDPDGQDRPNPFAVLAKMKGEG